MKIAIYDTYGRQKINGISALKVGRIGSIVLKRLGFTPIKEARYNYFDIKGEYVKLPKKINNSCMCRFFAVYSDKAEVIFNNVQTFLKESKSEYLSDWVILIA